MTAPVAAPHRVFPAEPAPAVIASARAIMPILTSNAAAADRGGKLTGADRAQFALVTVVPHGAGGDAALRTVVPKSDMILHEGWGAAGMRSAGCMTIDVDGLFIPEDHLSPAPLPRGYDPTHALVPASVVVGTAGGALDHALRTVRHRPWSGTRFRTAADWAIIQARLTDAAMHFSGARLHVHRLATTIDDVLGGFVELDAVTRIRCRVDAGCAASAAMATMDSLMSAIGAEAVAESAPFARAWRDVQTLARHGAVDPLTAREAYGRFLVAEDRTIPGIPL